MLRLFQPQEAAVHEAELPQLLTQALLPGRCMPLPLWSAAYWLSARRVPAGQGDCLQTLAHGRSAQVRPTTPVHLLPLMKKKNRIMRAHRGRRLARAQPRGLGMAHDPSPVNPTPSRHPCAQPLRACRTMRPPHCCPRAAPGPRSHLSLPDTAAAHTPPVVSLNGGHMRALSTGPHSPMGWRKSVAASSMASICAGYCSRAKCCTHHTLAISETTKLAGRHCCFACRQPWCACAPSLAGRANSSCTVQHVFTLMTAQHTVAEPPRCMTKVRNSLMLVSCWSAGA